MLFRFDHKPGARNDLYVHSKPRAGSSVRTKSKDSVWTLAGCSVRTGSKTQSELEQFAQSEPGRQAVRCFTRTKQVRLVRAVCSVRTGPEVDSVRCSTQSKRECSVRASADLARAGSSFRTESQDGLNVSRLLCPNRVKDSVRTWAVCSVRTGPRGGSVRCSTRTKQVHLNLFTTRFVITRFWI